MNAKGFRTILFIVVILVFIATATLTLLGVSGLHPVPDFYLKLLVGALLVENAGAVLAVFKHGQFFVDQPAPASALSSTESIGPVSERQLAMHGSWKGTARQEVGPDGLAFDADMHVTFSVSRDQISGRLEYRFMHPVEHRPVVLEFTLIGRFLYERFARFEYENVLKRYIQFGSIIFELDPAAEEIYGRFLGYGVETRNMVYGTMTLSKVT